MSINNSHNILLTRLTNWNFFRLGKTQNKDIIWFPKPRTEITDMRKMLKIANIVQQQNTITGKGEFFEENQLAKTLASLGSITRPGVGIGNTVSEYKNEQTANQPDVSSFRMLNRIFRLLGFVARNLTGSNRYVVTDLGKQFIKFEGPFPSKIGTLNENDFVVEQLVNASVFNVHDDPRMWDTRFRNRIVINLLKCTALNGYITNHEAVVTAFALQDERDGAQVTQMLERLERLHSGKIEMINAYQECNLDPHNRSVTNNAYDSPKVLTSICRQTGLFESSTVNLKDSPFGDLKDLYNTMFHTSSELSKPRVVNVLSNFGRHILENELTKRVIAIDNLVE